MCSLDYLGVSWSPLKWRTPLSSDVTSSITLRSITDLRSAIRLFHVTAPQLSVSPSEMLSLSDSADHSQRPFASMLSKRRSSTFRVTLRKSSYSSEKVWLPTSNLKIAQEINKIDLISKVGTVFRDLGWHLTHAFRQRSVCAQRKTLINIIATTVKQDSSIN